MVTSGNSLAVVAGAVVFWVIGISIPNIALFWRRAGRGTPDAVHADRRSMHLSASGVALSLGVSILYAWLQHVEVTRRGADSVGAAVSIGLLFAVIPAGGTLAMKARLPETLERIIWPCAITLGSIACAAATWLVSQRFDA